MPRTVRVGQSLLQFLGFKIDRISVSKTLSVNDLSRTFNAPNSIARVRFFSSSRATAKIIGNVTARGGQMTLKLRATHTRQLHINNEARGAGHLIGQNESLCRLEDFDSKTV
jgi:hypothetical protein